MLNDENCCAIFCMTQAACALEIACDSGKQKSYHLNRPLEYFTGLPHALLYVILQFDSDTIVNKHHLPGLALTTNTLAFAVFHNL